MKHISRVCRLVVPLFMVIVLAGCATKTGIEILEMPVSEIEGIEHVFNEGRYFPSTHGILRQLGPGLPQVIPPPRSGRLMPG